MFPRTKAPMAKVTELCGCTTATTAWAWRWNDEETTGLSAVREVADACREHQLTRRRARVAIATLDPDSALRRKASGRGQHILAPNSVCDV